jgi:hypothetical protein
MSCRTKNLYEPTLIRCRGQRRCPGLFVDVSSDGEHRRDAAQFFQHLEPADVAVNYNT